MKERVVIENFEAFCRTDLAELARRCCLTGVDVGNIVAKLANAWKSRPPPFIPPTLDEIPQAVVMNGWEPLSGKTLTAPVTALVTNTVYGVAVDIFVRDVSTLCHKRLVSGSWSDWNSFQQISAISRQAVVQYSQTCLAIYALEANGTCLEMYFKLNSRCWAEASNCLNGCLDGAIVAAPIALCSFTQNRSDPRTDLFALGPKNECMHSCWTNSKWSGWDSLGGVLMSEPVAVWTESNQLHVFALGELHNICHTWWDGTTWKPWETLSGRFISKPTVVAQSLNHFDIFALSIEHTVWCKSWNGTSWSTSWEYLGERSVSIQGVCVNPNRLDIFVVGTDGVCKRKIRNGGLWSDWQSLSGVFVSEMSAVCSGAKPDSVIWGRNRQHLLVQGVELV